jgi:hypothetical protein
MRLSREERETLLNDLLNPELDHATRSENLQKFRLAFDAADVEIEEYTAKQAKLESENKDLVISNSKLFRQLGTESGTPQQKEEAKEKQFSETVTIESLEKGV